MAKARMDDDAQKRLIAQWQETGRVLQQIRLTELAAMDDEESRQAAFDILRLADALPDDSGRERYSGLVEMQRLLSALHEQLRT
jgi:hypothetical protein